MYIKLHFEEQGIIIPQCWGGCVINMEKPQIISALPADTTLNTRVNIQSMDKNERIDDKDWIATKYDIYLDCGILTENHIKELIVPVRQKCRAKSKQQLDKDDGDYSVSADEIIGFLLDEHYPQNYFVDIFQQAVEDEQFKLAALSMPKLALEYANRNADQENKAIHDDMDASTQHLVDFFKSWNVICNDKNAKVGVEFFLNQVLIHCGDKTSQRNPFRIPDQGVLQLFSTFPAVQQSATSANSNAQPVQDGDCKKPRLLQ